MNTPILSPFRDQSSDTLGAAWPKGRGMDYFWVGIGGFFGANARYILGHQISHRLGMTFPYATLIVNLTGALLIGVLFTILTDRVVDDPVWRQLTIVGFLGGYTTFSSYTYEAVGLMQAGRWGSALAYVIGSNILGMIACYGGVWLVRALGG
jgi:fluoride exporter